MATPILQLNHTLGEGPLYDPRNHTLLWIDAVMGEVHRTRLPDNSGAEYSAEERAALVEDHQVVYIGGGKGNPKKEIVGALGLTKDVDIVVLTYTTGLGFVLFKTNEFIVDAKCPRFNVDDELRLNDGIIDPNGDFWCGAMDKHIGPNPTGRSKMYRVNASDLLVDALFDVQMLNGINAFQKDGRTTFFYTDTLTFTNVKWDYDLDSKTLGERLVHINVRDAYPSYAFPGLDGFAMTDEGHIYTAVWGTGSVAHYDENGVFVDKLDFPAQRILLCSFGGKDRDELFVTSALPHLPSEDYVECGPDDLGGSVWRVKLPGVKGLLKDNVWGGYVP